MVGCWLKITKHSVPISQPCQAESMRLSLQRPLDRIICQRSWTSCFEFIEFFELTRVDSRWLPPWCSSVLVFLMSCVVIDVITMFGTILSIQSGKEAACQIHWGFAVIAMLGYHMVASYFRMLTPLLQQFTFPNRPIGPEIATLWITLRVNGCS